MSSASSVPPSWLPPSWVLVRPDPEPEVDLYVSNAAFICSTPEKKALEHCKNLCIQTQVGVTALFWSTQSKRLQIAYRDYLLGLHLDQGLPAAYFSNYRDHFLCFKCERWVSDHRLPDHLNIEELRLYRNSRVSMCHTIPNSTASCRTLAKLPYSRTESNYLHLKLLRLTDFPTYCPKCKCLVMSTFLPTHVSNSMYCAQAKLAVSTSHGTLVATRWSYYPGHPLFHLHYVGRWPVLALLGFKLLHWAARSRLLLNFTRVCAIARCSNFRNLTSPVVLDILDFFDLQCPEDYFLLLADVYELLLVNKGFAARRLVSFFAKIQDARLLEDPFGLAV